MPIFSESTGSLLVFSNLIVPLMLICNRVENYKLLVKIETLPLAMLGRIALTDWFKNANIQVTMSTYSNKFESKLQVHRQNPPISRPDSTIPQKHYFKLATIQCVILPHNDTCYKAANSGQLC